MKMQAPKRLRPAHHGSFAVFRDIRLYILITVQGSPLPVWPEYGRSSRIEVVALSVYKL